MVNETQLTQEEKIFSMLAHLSALAGYVVLFGNILGPLVIWLIKKDQSEWVDRQGKEALNFQLSITIYAAISLVLVIVLVGFLLLFAVGVFSLVMSVVAAVKANTGEDFHYPLCIRFIK
ncbi:MAG TPA: DUF4870 domain-containing protein [Candidatus Limnocylindrales bacterium]|nr:DUF4870 domain-containing protein [Candidatus Limnocylindrales bacterium]